MSIVRVWEIADPQYLRGFIRKDVLVILFSTTNKPHPLARVMDSHILPSLIRAAITATFVQSVMYGLYVASTLHALRWLLYDDNGWRIRDKHKLLMTALVALFSLLLSVDLGISLLLTINPQSSFIFSIANITIENATVLIADGVLIYRCWIVYESWRVVLIPIVLWLADLAFALMFAVFQVANYLVIPLQIKIDYPLSMMTWTLFYAFNIAINIYTTLAIVYRIWRVARNSKNTDRGRLYSISRILAESGILLTITSAMNLGATANYLRPMPYVIRPTMDALHFSMTGITFNLILIRIGSEGADTGDDYTVSKSDGGGGQQCLSTVQFHASAIGGADQGVSSSPCHVQKDQEEIQEVVRWF